MMSDDDKNTSLRPKYINTTSYLSDLLNVPPSASDQVADEDSEIVQRKFPNNEYRKSMKIQCYPPIINIPSIDNDRGEPQTSSSPEIKNNENVKPSICVEENQEGESAVKIFLKKHHSLRLNLDKSGPSNPAGYHLKVACDEYVGYLETHEASPNAVRSSFLYCVRTDDDILMVQLLRDVGIAHLMRNCFLIDGVEFNVDTKKEEGGNVPQRNAFWMACYYGSNKILDIIVKECIALFYEKSLNQTAQISLQQKKIELDQAKKNVTDILHEPSSDGSTPMLISSCRGHATAVSILLSYGVNPKMANEFGDTPPILAALHNHVQVLEILGQSLDVDFNKSNNLGMNPALVACKYGHLETLKFLSQSNEESLGFLADLNIRDSKGVSCIHISVMQNQHQVTSYLQSIYDPQNKKSPDINYKLMHPNDPTDITNGDTVLHTAARMNNCECVATFLTNTPVLFRFTATNEQAMTVLHIAAKENYHQIVRILLEKLDKSIFLQLNSNDVFGISPLYYACSSGHIKIVKLLAPVFNLNEICVNMRMGLTKEGGVITKQSALVIATMNSHVEIVSELLTHGADANLGDEVFGHTPLSIAAKAGNLPIVQVLVNHGANLRSKSKKGGKTPIQKARKYKHQEVEDFLDSCGAC